MSAPSDPDLLEALLDSWDRNNTILHLARNSDRAFGVLCPTAHTAAPLVRIVGIIVNARRRLSRKPLLVVCLLCLVALEGTPVQSEALQGRAAGDQRARPNTWSARSSTGQTLAGTWTAVADPSSGTVSGTWTLVDAEGKAVTRGGWSAAKSRTGWTGSWRAAVSGSRIEYAGTWSAGVNLAPDAALADLFKSAVQAVVSGTWRAGRQRGTWSIRAFD
jgi:hypothetical protein